jgi:predicted adenine nucleotide alpha hydrolase (AANH) superfamily ATPase
VQQSPGTLLQVLINYGIVADCGESATQRFNFILTTDDYFQIKLMRKLLLHICCAPDLTIAYERTCAEFEVVGFFSNSCIEPRGEYYKRISDVKHLAKIQDIEILEDEYSSEAFLALTRGLEHEPEKGRRCKKCIEYRLRRTAERAKSEGFDLFATTLTVSPHKDAKFINETGTKIAFEFDLEYLATDFKKQDGFKCSVELSKKLGLYRQQYCGCRFSLAQKRERQTQIEAQTEVTEAEKSSAKIEVANIKVAVAKGEIVLPPGAFFKPQDQVSRRFKMSPGYKKTRK